MKNVNLITILKVNGIETRNEITGILNEESRIIEYVEDNQTKVTLDMNNKIIIRENNEIYMNLIFDEKKVTNNEILVKEFNKKIKLLLNTKKITTKNLYFDVVYEVVDGDTFNYIVMLSK